MVRVVKYVTRTKLINNDLELRRKHQLILNDLISGREQFSHNAQ